MKTYFDSVDFQNHHKLFADLFEIQTDSYGYIDSHQIKKSISDFSASSVIDIGSGDATFIIKIARENPDVSFWGFESNADFAAIATKNIRESKLSNISIQNKTLGVDYIDAEADIVLTRLTLQHVKHPMEFLNHFKKVSKKGGKLYFIEPIYDYYDCDPPAPIWLEYRERLLCTYRRMGSNPNLPKQISGWLNEINCEDISTCMHIYSPVTIGKNRFLKVVRATAAALHSIHPDLWERDYLDRLDNWLELTGIAGRVDPFITIAHTTAIVK